MAFTYVPTTDIGKVRFRIGDTTLNQGVKPDASNFSDEEIQVVLTEQGTVESAVNALFAVLADLWMAVADLTMGPRSEKLSQVAAAYRKRVESVDGGQSSGSVVSGVTVSVPVAWSW